MWFFNPYKAKLDRWMDGWLDGFDLIELID
jgi:hypothetical protein